MNDNSALRRRFCVIHAPHTRGKHPAAYPAHAGGIHLKCRVPDSCLQESVVTATNRHFREETVSQLFCHSGQAKRDPESSIINSSWMPAFAGMTSSGLFSQLRHSLEGGNTERTERGFTLLEIMISLVLLCLVVVSIIQLSSANLQNLAASGESIETLTRANDKMREVLDSEEFEEKSWTDRDDEGYAYEVRIEEIEKERSEALTVRLLQITVTAGKTDFKKSRKVTLKTAKMAPKSDALTGGGKSS